MLSSLTPLKQLMAFQCFSGFPLLITLEKTLFTQAGKSCVFWPLPPCSALPLQAALTLQLAAGALLFPGTGFLHLLFSLARVFLSSLLFQGNPLRSTWLNHTPLYAGVHTLQSYLHCCVRAKTAVHASLAIFPQEGLPVPQLLHL